MVVLKMNISFKNLFLLIAVMFGIEAFFKCEAAEVWPTNSYVEVKAYVFNLESQMDVRFLNGTNLNADVFNADGARLNQTQVKELLKAITGKHPEHMVALCYNPHHAFVFFDSTGKPVASFEICFECSNYYWQPQRSLNKYNYIDIKSVRKIVQELGLPIYNKDEDYLALKKNKPKQ
jgi:hypothetical protein